MRPQTNPSVYRMPRKWAERQRRVHQLPPGTDLGTYGGCRGALCWARGRPSGPAGFCLVLGWWIWMRWILNEPLEEKDGWESSPGGGGGPQAATVGAEQEHSSSGHEARALPSGTIQVMGFIWYYAKESRLTTHGQELLKVLLQVRSLGSSVWEKRLSREREWSRKSETNVLKEM